MSESFICKGYRFDKAAFSGTFEVPEGFEPVKAYFKDIKGGRIYEGVSFGPGGTPGEYYIEADCADAAFYSGTWHPVMEGSGGERHLFFYKRMKNEKKCGKMLALSKDALFFDANERYHYMAAIDGDSRFSIRKWRNKSKVIKKTSVYVKRFASDGMKVSFDLAKSRLKPAKQAELWLWNKNIKEVFRIKLSPKDVNNLSFTADFSEFFDEYGGRMLKQWDVFLVCNRNGTYCQSRIVLKDKEKYANGVAVQSGDDSDRYILNVPCAISGGAPACAFQLFFDGILRLCARTVDARYMYRGVYRERMESFSLKKGVLGIRVRCGLSEFSDKRLIVRHKREDAEAEDAEAVCECSPTSVEKVPEGEILTFDINCDGIKWAPPRYEIALAAKKDGNEYEFRLIGGGEKFDRLLTSVYKHTYVTSEGYLVYLISSISGKIVMECRRKSKYDKGRYRWNEAVSLAIYPVLKKFYKRKKNLLFFEKFCNAAQDNAYFMFEYFVHKGDKDFRPLYIIEKDRPAYRKLRSGYGRKAIPFMSIRHLMYLQAADLLISTDSKRHCYRWYAGNRKFLNMIVNEKKSVFLQHGVLGFKKVDNIYGKEFANRADLFITSSEEEKDIVIRYFGYDKKEVAVTGLARWDKLVSAPASPPEIFYMPTWRNWITELGDGEFAKTDYFKSYEEILNSERLSEILEKNDAYMMFCFHPKFRDYMHLINVKNPRIKLINYDDDIKINKLLMECSMFVTDYSSASWDAYYMDKPVLFYQFDYDEYMKKQGAYINMERGISRDRVTDFDGFIKRLSEIIEGGFAKSAGSGGIVEDFLPARRGCHRKRIYDEIVKRFL